MNEDPFKNKERLAIRVELARPEDWQVCRDLRIESITGSDAEAYGLTPEEVQKEKDKSENAWMEETSSKDMFSVLAWNGSKAVGLGRTRKTEDVWRMRNGYVKLEFRNMGIQQKMVAIRLNEIMARGGTKVLTGIKIDNRPSIHVAEKFGFKVVEEDNGWYFMELDLTKPEVLELIKNVLDEG